MQVKSEGQGHRFKFSQRRKISLSTLDSCYKVRGNNHGYKADLNLKIYISNSQTVEFLHESG